MYKSIVMQEVRKKGDITRAYQKMGGEKYEQ